MWGSRVRVVKARAYIVEIQSRAVYVDENPVRCWFGLRRIFRKLNLGRVVELADYERAHNVGRDYSKCQLSLCSITCLCSGAEALMAGRTSTGSRSDDVVTV